MTTQLLKSLYIFTAAASISLLTQISHADTYKLDPVHSSASFSVTHLGIATVYGRFNAISGNFFYDAKKLNSSEVQVTIKANSVDTNHEKRDQHLRSPDFFDAKQFPEIVFESTQYKKNEKGDYIVGKLTMHGVTKTTSFRVKNVAEGKDPWGGYRVGVLAEGQIKRSEFGVSHFIPGVSDEVFITLSVEGIRQ